jgi:hypothetical protein
MPRRKRTPTIAADLQVITRQLAALTERVREAEAVKNAVDSVMKSTNSRTATTSTGKRRGRPPGSKNKAKPANGRRRRRTTAAAAAPATGRRRPGRPRKTPAATMG